MYVIIGANGFLGNYILKELIKSTTENIIAVSRSISDNSSQRIKWFLCDICIKEQVDKLSIFLKKKNESLKVIYLASFHHPDEVSRNKRFSWNVNITSLSYVINILEDVEMLFYASSDSVYGESHDQYHFTERDMINPFNAYGKQKATAEQIILGYGYNVVRFPFLIGPSLLCGKKHFYDKIAESLCSGKPVEMFVDSYRSALGFNDASRLLIQLMELKMKGLPSILNICGDDDLSKYDIGLMIADALGVARELVLPIFMEQGKGIFATARAKTTLMNNTELKKILKISEIKITSIKNGQRPPA
jgi:nucleoside-diphosphate-sugar epimerase